MVRFSDEVRQRIRDEADRVRVRGLAEQNPTFRAAVFYCKRGWHPIPVRPDRKVPRFEWKAYQTQKPTLKELISWWTAHPRDRVGLVTGAVPSLVVIDVDPRHGGTLEGLDGITGASVIQTPSGGYHVYMAHPGRPVPSRAGVRRGVDVRGDGGFVLAPPSPGYVLQGAAIRDSLPPAPSWVCVERQGTGESSQARKPPGWFATTFAGSTPEGERNDTASKLAGYLLGKGHPQEVTVTILTDWARRCSPPFALGELSAVVASIAAREADKGEETDEERPALQLWLPRDLPDTQIEFVIDSLLPKATLSLSFGRDKIGKTLLAEAMVRAIRTGEAFLGRFGVLTGPVIVLLLDDPPALTRERLLALGLGDDDGLFVATHLDADTDHPMRLLDALREEALARRPALIVLDALYTLLEGAEQLHLAGGMRPVMRMLDRIAEESGAAVLLVHHARRADEEIAGSFVIRASAKSILRLTKPREERDGDGDESQTTRRILRVEGKYQPEQRYALDFTGGAWVLLGEAGEIRQQELGTVLLEAVTRDPGLTGDELADRITKRKGDVARALGKLAQAGRVHSREVPTGGRGRPKRTWWPGAGTSDFGISPPSPGPRVRGENRKSGDGRDQPFWEGRR